MSAADRDEGFLKRWSRRKAEARQAPDAQATPAEAPPPEDSTESAPAVDPAELPDPDTLTKDSDFTVYLREGVPEALRRRALRRLWRSDPVFANLDGLNDYDGDFTRNAIPVGAAIKTAWRVGKGYLDEAGEDEQQAQPAEGVQFAEGEAKGSHGEEQSSPPDKGHKPKENPPEA